eukprot:UN23509
MFHIFRVELYFALWIRPKNTCTKVFSSFELKKVKLLSCGKTCHHLQHTPKDDELPENKDGHGLEIFEEKDFAG